MKTATPIKPLNLALLLLWALMQPIKAQSMPEAGEKIYVAIEGEGRIAVFEPRSGRQIGSIDLSRRVHGQRIELSPHNVQVAPDGKTVWVTANGAHGETQHQSEPPADSAHADDAGGASAPEHQAMHHETDPAADEVVVIDPSSETIVKRIPIATGAHLAHVVVTPDGTSAYVTAQNQSTVYKIDARNYRVAGKIQFPSGTQPHGLRLAPDGLHAYIALLAAKGLGILDLKSDQFRTLPVDGAPVQTAVTADGKRVLASLYDTKKIAVYDVAAKSLRYLNLPKTSQGPVQLYPSPDSRFVYVADQGHYFGQPDGNRIFKADLQDMQIVESITAGDAPHGIVVSKDGAFACVTNLVSNDLSFIDLATGKESARIAAGKEPNGVSIWSKHGGGTP